MAPPQVAAVDPADPDQDGPEITQETQKAYGR